jgi:hypothetical protein
MCTTFPSCSDLPIGKYYIQTTGPVVRDSIGNPLLDGTTKDSWSFFISANSNQRRPEITFTRMTLSAPGVKTVHMQFSKAVWYAPGGIVNIADCGPDWNCGTEVDNHNTSILAQSLTYQNSPLAGPYGHVSFTLNTAYTNRRYEVSVPINLVQDSPSYSGTVSKLYGPPAVYSFYVDFGYVEGPILNANASHPKDRDKLFIGVDENIILAFNEVVQAGTGNFELWEDTNSSHSYRVLRVDVASLVLPSSAHRSLFSGNLVNIWPRSLCALSRECSTNPLPTGSYHVRTDLPGVLKNKAGGLMAALNTQDTLSFEVVNVTVPGTVMPSLGFVAGQHAYSASIAGTMVYPFVLYMYFTRNVSVTNNATVLIEDCGEDLDCGITVDNLLVACKSYGLAQCKNKETVLLASEPPIGSTSWENGLVQLSTVLPHTYRRYQITIMEEFIQDCISILIGLTQQFGWSSLSNTHVAYVS